MTGDNLTGHDLRPFTGLTNEDRAWLRDFQAAALADELVIDIGDGLRDEDAPIVWCSPDGEWWAGRYVGVVAFRGRRLTIQPRVGMEILTHWLATAMNVVLVPARASLHRDDAFLPALMAHVWSHAVVQAARHGLPYLRVETDHIGPFVRGRLDVRGTTRLRRRQEHRVASKDRERSLDHDLGRVMIAAEWSLTRALQGTYWQSQRLKELLGVIRSAVGARPPVPTEHELGQVRYTPIRLPWKPVAQLSHHIATNRGLLPTPDEAEATGVLVDVAELWELFLLRALRRALSPLSVRHGTRELRPHSPHLLTSRSAPDRGLGRLLPDYVVEDRLQGSTVAVLDAKYKSLSPTVARPAGVDRGDLYQLAAYLARFGSEGRVDGALLYPIDDDAEESRAEVLGPWASPTGATVRFTRCPLVLKEAVPFLAGAFGGDQDGHPRGEETVPDS